MTTLIAPALDSYGDSALAGLGDYRQQADKLQHTSLQVRPATAGFIVGQGMPAGIVRRRPASGQHEHQPDA